MHRWVRGIAFAPVILFTFGCGTAAAGDDASEHLNLSDTLRSHGMLDRALEEANTAARLDPKSPAVLLNLARARESDPVGRLFQPGFDRAGALQVLHTLERVDPTNLIGRYELVLLLEYDSDGVRYSYKASLAQAADELLAVRKLPGYDDRWDVELLQLLGMAGKFEKIPPLVAGMNKTEQTQNWLLASAFFLGGQKAARAAAQRISLNRAATARAFYGAAGALEIARQYDKARQLMALSSVDAANAAHRAENLQILSRTQRHEEEEFDAADPQDALRQMMVLMLRPTAENAPLSQILSRTSQRLFARNPALFMEAFGSGARELEAFTRLGYGIDTAIDIILSSGSMTVEGTTQKGFVVRRRIHAAEDEALVIVEDGKARVLATSRSYDLAGPEALARADAGLEDEALFLLEWAGKHVNAPATDDPLGAPAFSHFWPIATGDSIEYAAAALASSRGDPDAVATLVKGRSATTSYERKIDFDIALAAAYFAQQDWKSLAPIAERLSSAYPDSANAFKYRSAAYRGLQEWAKADAVTADWLARHKNDPVGIMARAMNTLYQGNFHDARAILTPLLGDEFVWSSVAANEVDERTVRAAREAGNKIALACVYALSGSSMQALNALVEGMNAAGMRAPTAAAWFAQGLIAESLGDSKSAQLYYGRVTPDPLQDGSPASVYNLAHRKLGYHRPSPNNPGDSP